MTENAFIEDMEKSKEAGMDEHLSKPVDIAVLERAVRKYLVTPPLHSHSPEVHGALARPLRPSGDALLPSTKKGAAASSVVCLSPATLSARNH